MIYALTLLNILSLALVVYLVRQHGVERSELLNRIQAPQQSVAQALTEKAGPLQPAHISPFDDEAMAEYENERDRQMRETQELVLANSSGPE